LDSSDPPITQYHRLKKLLEQSRFFELPPALELPDPEVDRTHYKVTVENKKIRAWMCNRIQDQDCKITLVAQCARTRSVVQPNSTSRIGL
jgi:hypothetical protein